MPVSWTKPSSSVIGSNTDPLLPSVERLNISGSSCSSASLSPVSARPAESSASQAGTGQLRSCRLGEKTSVIPELDHNLYSVASKQIEAAEQAVEDRKFKIRAKRSFRNFFHRRGHTITSQPARKQDSKRSSIAGSVLALRIRDSSNHSKVSMTKQTETTSQTHQNHVVTLNHIEPPGKDANGQAALSALDPDRSVSISPPTGSIARCETATIVNKILDRVMSMNEASPDRLRGLEIAEVIYFSLCCYHNPRISLTS